MKILIINGPNLNFLGIREPHIYGKASYLDLTNHLKKKAEELNIEITIVQTNYEGKIIDLIQESYYNHTDGVILNAGGYTHYSIAIRDAIASINLPVVEVHLSNIYCRESFRHVSMIKDVCIKSFMGKGFESYDEALSFLKERSIKNE